MQLKGLNKFDIADNPPFEENLVEVSKSEQLDEKENPKYEKRSSSKHQSNSISNIKVTI